MTQPVQEPTQGRQDARQDFGTRQLFRRPSPAPSSIPQPWFVLFNDNGATTTTAVWSTLAYQEWARMNDTAGDYFLPQNMGGRFAANITKQGVYLIEFNVIWDGPITTGATSASLQSAAATVVAWETGNGDRYTQLFTETDVQQNLITTFFKATDTDCIIDPRVKQNTGVGQDASSMFLKIIRLTDAGPSADWDTGII